MELFARGEVCEADGGLSARSPTWVCGANDRHPMRGPLLGKSRIEWPVHCGGHDMDPNRPIKWGRLSMLWPWLHYTWGWRVSDIPACLRLRWILQPWGLWELVAGILYGSLAVQHSDMLDDTVAGYVRCSCRVLLELHREHRAIATSFTEQHLVELFARGEVCEADGGLSARSLV